MEKYDELLNSCVNSLRSCKKHLESHLNKADQQELQKMLKDITKGYCEIDTEFKKSRSAIDNTMKYFSTDENDCTKQVEDVYKEFLSNEVENGDFTEHPIWKRLNREQKTQDEENTSADCSVLVSQPFKPPIDPITKKAITDPYRNKICNHVYDYNSITTYMQSLRNDRVRCPYIGCNNTNMGPTFLERDEELKDDIEDYLAGC